jgi:cytochrome c oxidase subunit 2
LFVLAAFESVAYGSGVFMRARARSATAVAVTSILAGCTGWQSALDPQSPQSDQLKHLLIIFLVIAAIVWAGVMAALFLGLTRRNRDRNHPLAVRAPFERAAGQLIASGGVATTLIVLGLSIISYRTQGAIYGKAPDSLAVKVIGHQWWWEVQYEADGPYLEFTTANEIRVPVGKPVTVKLETADVIHSFWVPSLMGKMDLINGQQNAIQFTAKNAGVYRGQCAEFCGLQHAHMAFTVVALPPAQFSAWRDAQIGSAATPPDALGQRGELLFRSRGCALCHSIRGTPAGGQLGPDLTHLADRTTIAAGALHFSPGALAAWIADPQHIKPGNYMPRMPIHSDEMVAIVHYLENLR